MPPRGAPRSSVELNSVLPRQHATDRGGVPLDLVALGLLTDAVHAAGDQLHPEHPEPGASISVHLDIGRDRGEVGHELAVRAAFTFSTLIGCRGRRRAARARPA